MRKGGRGERERLKEGRREGEREEGKERECVYGRKRKKDEEGARDTTLQHKGHLLQTWLQGVVPEPLVSVVNILHVSKHIVVAILHTHTHVHTHETQHTY